MKISERYLLFYLKNVFESSHDKYHTFLRVQSTAFFKQNAFKTRYCSVEIEPLNIILNIKHVFTYMQNSA